MAAGRSVWSGFIRFGLVSVPVKAYTATASGGGGISLNQLHRECNSRINYKKTCPIHGEVKPDDIVSGYEFAKGQYVIVEPDELDEMRTANEKAIDVKAFIPPDELDARYYTGKTWYLLPDGPVALKPYRLLYKTLEGQDLVAFAQVVVSGKEQLLILRPISDLLVASYVSYSTELKNPDDFKDDAPKVEVAPDELRLAKTLTDAMKVTDFDLSEYTHVHRKAHAIDSGESRGETDRRPAVRGGPAGHQPDGRAEEEFGAGEEGRVRQAAQAGGAQRGTDDQRGKTAENFVMCGKTVRCRSRRRSSARRPRSGQMLATKSMPSFIPPMLAVPGEPFDSDEYEFEIKWDGTRAVTFIDRAACYRIVNRRRIDITSRYPEFSSLADLPTGTVLDGEVVVLRDGRPDFHALQSREHASHPRTIGTVSVELPATYIVFDLLYLGYKPLMHMTCAERRKRLGRLVRDFDNPRLAFSDGVVGRGRDYFQAACERGLEGVIAKRLGSGYVPGKRTGAWIKIKQKHAMLCAVIGFLPDGTKDFRSLLLASEQDGKAVYVGRVSSGIDQQVRVALNELLWPLLRDTPVVACRQRAKWVEPQVYCLVRYLERTPSGQLRAPVFVELRNGD